MIHHNFAALWPLLWYIFSLSGLIFLRDVFKINELLNLLAAVSYFEFKVHHVAGNTRNHTVSLDDQAQRQCRDHVSIVDARKSDDQLWNCFVQAIIKPIGVEHRNEGTVLRLVVKVAALKNFFYLILHVVSLDNCAAAVTQFAMSLGLFVAGSHKAPLRPRCILEVVAVLGRKVHVTRKHWGELRNGNKSRAQNKNHADV